MWGTIKIIKIINKITFKLIIREWGAEVQYTGKPKQLINWFDNLLIE